MKKVLLIAAICVMAFTGWSQNNVTCWRTQNYMILNDNGVHKHKGNAGACFNDNVFSFYTKETGIITLFVEVSSDGEGEGADKGHAKTEYVSRDRYWFITVINSKKIEIHDTRGPGQTVIMNNINFDEKFYNEVINRTH